MFAPKLLPYAITRFRYALAGGISVGSPHSGTAGAERAAGIAAAAGRGPGPGRVASRGSRMTGTAAGFVVTTAFFVTVAPGAIRSR